MACLCAALWLPGSVRAEVDDAAGPAQEQTAAWSRRLAEAQDLQKTGAAREMAAKEALEARTKACYRKIRVNACRNEARQEYIQEAHEAHRIENEGKAQERAVKKEQLADKDTRHLAEAPRREAELAAREAATRAEREQAKSSQAGKLAAKEEKARVGAERRVAEEERRRKKQERHEKQVAEKMEKARQQEAEGRR